MKKLLVAVVLLTMVVFSTSGAFAQGKIGIGVGVDVIKFIGNFGDVYSIGFGGTARGQYSLQDQLSLLLTAGYLTASAKDQAGIKLDAASLIPILVGAKYYFTPSSQGGFRAYGIVELGITSFKQSIPAIQTPFGTFGGGSVSSTEFTYAPGVGGELPLGGGGAKLDVAVRWNGISDGNGIGGRVGVLFPVGN